MPRRDNKDDDGRTIADMSMPDITRRRNGQPTPSSPEVSPNRATSAGDQREPLDARTARRAALHAGLAALLIAVCFLAAFGLFILFCTQVWFR